MNGTYLTIGLISGTSVDGIDAGLFAFNFDDGKTTLEIVKAQTYAYPDSVRQEILRQIDGVPEALHRLTLLNMRLGELFADAVNRLLREAQIPAERVTVIGSHGQTLYHVAERELFCGELCRGTLQIGEGDVIAQRTGIQTVSDFRSADIAAGGTGAPFAPFIERVMADNFPGPVAFQNIGGIGNVGYFYNGKLIAFDTGPGNMIMDQLVERHSEGHLFYDRDGEIGLSGGLNESLLKSWMNHPYLKQPPPKSTGRELFGGQFFQDFPPPADLPMEDIIHTAAVYTARSISRSYQSFLPEIPKTMIVSGGGAHNPIVMKALKTDLPQTTILTGDEAGISTDFKEAAAFALMALHYIMNLPGNEPEATGADTLVITGKLSKPLPKG